jgi:tetratricopeptide (TPR) repeat protein
MSDPRVNDQFVLLNDQPISTPDGMDVLGIASEVSGLANLIMGSRYSAPFTVGIDADWGMGKSTLMLQLQAALDAHQKEGVVTRWFNAWTAQRGDVLAGLIKSALMEVDENALRRLLRKAAANHGLLIGLRAMLIAAASFLHLGSVVDQLWDLMSADTRTRNEILKDLEGEFYKWAAQTKRTPNGRLLVVFVDDLDRCSTETIVGVCEAIRLYLAVPGVVFVIGCDQQVLTRAAQRSGMDSQAATSLGFLEKIIQITYRKPAPNERQLSSLVEYYAGLSQAGSLFSEQVRHIVMQGTGRNPRRVKRLLNSIILQYRLDPEWQSLGLEALSAVNLLWHFYPEFYRELTRPNSADLIHGFLTYREVRGRVQRGDPLSDQDREFFKANDAPEPTTEGQNIRDAFSFLEAQLPKSFSDLAGQQEFVQLMSELADAPKFDQLMDWFQRRAPANAAQFVLGADEGSGADEDSIAVGMGSVVGEGGGIAVGQVVYSQRPGVAGMPVVRLAEPPRLLTGREDLLTDLETRLASGSDSGLRTVALVGLAGTGKTSVALAYAHRHLAELGVAWQFAADEPAVLAAGFGELAAQLGTRDLVDARDPVASVHGALAAFPAEWLLIFDNAPNPGSLMAFLPPAGRGRVLITSRNPNWPSAQVLRVFALDAGVAAAFLVNRTGDRDSQAALELANELGGLPLALEQAAAYIQATGGSLAAYLILFRQRRPELLARGEAAGYAGTVTTSWSLAFHRLEESAPSAVGLLQLLACYAPDAIPLSLLLQPGPGLADKFASEVSPVLVPLLEDDLAARDAVAALRQYSLVVPAGDGLLSMHKLVQAVTTDQMPPMLREAWRAAAAVLIEAAIPADTRLPDSWPTCALLLPHAQAVLPDDSDGIYRLANYLGYSGSYAAALELQQRVVAARERLYGAEDARTLTSLDNLALAYVEAGRTAEAIPLHEQALAERQRVLGPDHPDTLTSLDNLALAYLEAGRTAEAIPLLEQALADMERVLGPDHPSTLGSRNNLANAYLKAGRPAEAIPLYEQALAAFERVLGADHPNTLTSRNNLAIARKAAGQAN